jgi:hypothetical protein
MKAKILNSILVAFCFITLISFQSDKSTENDKALAGIWKGFEVEKQLEGIEKHWIVQRFSNGTYTIMFTTKQNCEIETFTEKGKWWTKGNLFYEKNESSDEPEIYEYSIKENLVVHFKSKSTTYEFDDYRLE